MCNKYCYSECNFWKWNKIICGLSAYKENIIGENNRIRRINKLFSCTIYVKENCLTFSWNIHEKKTGIKHCKQQNVTLNNHYLF